MRVWLVASLVMMAGCVAGSHDNAEGGPTPTKNPLPGVTLALPDVVDPARGGSEPYVEVLPSGTLLLAAHAGATQLRPGASLDLLDVGATQSHLWRSVDSGRTWNFVSPVQQLNVPRGTGVGVSDPALAVAPDGTAYMVDLTAAGISVSVSKDDGKSWVFGNPLAGQAGDRPWITAVNGTAWISASRTVWRSNDGLQWNQIGSTNASGALSVRPGTHTVFAGAGAGFDISNNSGVSWASLRVPDHNADGAFPPFAPAVATEDGHVFAVWSEHYQVWAARFDLQNEKWDWVVPLSEGSIPRGTQIWPWVSAVNSTVAYVSWYEADKVVSDPAHETANWRLSVSALLDQAGGPRIAPEESLKISVHTGPICFGTQCQADPSTDRRMGDYFSSKIDGAGALHIGFAITTPGDPLARIEHVSLNSTALSS